MSRRRPETTVRMEIRGFLQTVGFAVWDLEQGYRKERGGTRQTPGLGDLYALGHDMSLWVECKSEKGRLSLAQLQFQTECRQNGQRYEVWRDVREAFDWCVEQGIIVEAR